MASPLFRINGGAVGVKASVSAAGAVTAALDSTDGVHSTDWYIDTTDDLSEPGDYVLVKSGSVGQNVATTALTAGTAAKIRARINGGNDAHGRPDPDNTNATSKFFVPTALGREVGCAGEEFESDATNGSTGIINAAIRETGGASIVDIVGTLPITVSGTTTRTVAINAATVLAAGSMSATHFSMVDNATSAMTASTIVLRGSSSEAAFGFLTIGATPAGAGSIRLTAGAAIQSRVGGADLNLIADNGSGAVTIGDLTDATTLTITAAGAITTTSTNGPFTVAVGGNVRFEADTTGIAFFGGATVSQQADTVALTDNSGGTANDTIEALPDPADSPASADALRDDLVANLIPALRNDIADLTAKYNALRTLLRTYKLMA